MTMTQAHEISPGSSTSSRSKLCAVFSLLPPSQEMPFPVSGLAREKFLNDQHYRVCLHPPLHWATEKWHSSRKNVFCTGNKRKWFLGIFFFVTVQRYSNKVSNEVLGLGLVWTDFWYSTVGFCPGCLRFSCSWLWSGCPVRFHWRHR